MAKYWIKLWTRTLNNRDLRRVDPAWRYAWIGLQLLAGEGDQGDGLGRVVTPSGFPLEDREIADALALDLDVWLQARAYFLQRGLLFLEDGTLVVAPYQEEQQPRDPTAAARMQRLRRRGEEHAGQDPAGQHRAGQNRGAVTDDVTRNVTRNVTVAVTPRLRAEAESEVEVDCDVMGAGPRPQREDQAEAPNDDPRTGMNGGLESSSEARSSSRHSCPGQGRQPPTDDRSPPTGPRPQATGPPPSQPELLGPSWEEALASAQRFGLFNAASLARFEEIYAELRQHDRLDWIALALAIAAEKNAYSPNYLIQILANALQRDRPPRPASTQERAHGKKETPRRAGPARPHPAAARAVAAASRASKPAYADDRAEFQQGRAQLQQGDGG